MGIQIANPPVQIAVVYDHIHLARLEIDQAVFEDDALPPVYKVRVAYRKYGIVDGVRHYQPAEHVIGVSDFLQLAMQKVGSGDTSLVSALQAIEQAVAAIIADNTGNATSVV
jgi:hypothetical protein